VVGSRRFCYPVA